ncbi:mitogen-activated protein kinase [Colletotrichum sp. CLE4]
MADDDWKTQLLASDRYENIQRIKSVLEAASPDAKATSQSDAFSVENQAYKDSSSRTQYDEICQLVGSANLSRPEASAPADDQPEDAGVTIGSYKNCISFASGITSEVYRCKDRALKVIVETHNIEPHNPQREAKILATLKRPCIPLLEAFRDQEQRFVLVFPYKPMTLADVIDKGTIPLPQVRRLFKDIFTALVDIHSQGIVHRDVKPEAILLDGADGPAYLSDFGTAWHPTMSIISEPAKSKILDIGTGPYRAPETLFGDKAYGPSVDMWAAGAMLAECCRSPSKPLFESRPAHEDGNQLGLILSIFKTLGTPTRETWPEAASFKTPPFEMYRMFNGQPWTDILPEVDPQARDLISSLVRFDSKRATSEQIEDRERGASAIANRVLATRQPARVTKSTTRLRKESLRRSSQIVWANRLGKVISVAIPEDVPKTTDSDTSMDECLVSDVVESDTDVSDADQESVPACVEPITDVKEKLGFNPEKPGPLSLEELRLRRIREAEEVPKLVREGLDRLI